MSVEGGNPTTITRHRGGVEEALQNGLKVVAMNSLTLMDENVSFQELYEILLLVAGKIANVNTSRLSPVVTTESDHDKKQPTIDTVALAELTGPLDRELKTLVSFGTKTAMLMMDRVDLLPQATTVHKPCHVFLSFPGEERFLYVPMLGEKLKEKDSTLEIFIDSKRTEPGMTSDAKTAIFRALLKAEVIVCICTFDGVQKKWPMAELLCGLARNQVSNKTGRVSRLIIDAMPGSSRTLQHPNWLEEIKQLIPMIPTPSICGCSGKSEGDFLQMALSICALLLQLSNFDRLSDPDAPPKN